MEVDKEQYIKWIEALRSGKYKQTKRRLQDSEGFCCLGVACNLLVENPTRDGYGFLAGSYSHNQLQAPYWLRAINDFSHVFYGGGLTVLNDYMEYSFEDIADYLELIGLSEGWIK